MSGNKQIIKSSYGTSDGYTLKSKKGTLLKKVEHSKGYSWHGFENRTYLGDLKIKFGFDKDNMPFGMQIIGNSFEEAKIYKLAAFLEKKLDLNLVPGGDK